jgi:hypothetical protein
VSFLDQLAVELSAVGIRSRRRTRILAEFGDHLDCDAGAQLGDPTALARQFADELGTVLARRAAFAGFAGLAVAALLFAVGALTAQPRLFSSAGGVASALGSIGAGLVALGGQVAVVAGTLAALRAFRRRRAPVVSRDEAVVMVRRTGVGLGAGLVTMVGFALSVIALEHPLADGWTRLALGLAAGGIAAIVLAAPPALAAARLRPVAPGSPGDLYEDLGPRVPLPLQGSPWRFALVVAAAVGTGVTLAGIVQSDPYDGLLRGLLDGAACLTGFGVLGRYLGLRG